MRDGRGAGNAVGNTCRRQACGDVVVSVMSGRPANSACRPVVCCDVMRCVHLCCVVFCVAVTAPAIKKGR